MLDSKMLPLTAPREVFLIIVPQVQRTLFRCGAGLISEGNRLVLCPFSGKYLGDALRDPRNENLQRRGGPCQKARYIMPNSITPTPAAADASAPGGNLTRKVGVLHHHRVDRVPVRTHRIAGKCRPLPRLHPHQIGARASGPEQRSGSEAE